MTALEQAAVKRRNMKIVFVLFLIGLFSAFGYLAVAKHAKKKQDGIEFQKFDPIVMLPQAQQRDPFACGQGLKWLTPFPKQDLTQQYVAACCHPPVEDMAGLVGPACKKLDR